MTRSKQDTARVSKPKPKPCCTKPKASPPQASATTPAPLIPDSPAPQLRARTPTRCTMGHQYYEHHDNPVAGHFVPKLRLSGRWLERCGFAIGDVLQVTVGQGMLLISRSRRD